MSENHGTKEHPALVLNSRSAGKLLRACEKMADTVSLGINIDTSSLSNVVIFTNGPYADMLIVGHLVEMKAEPSIGGRIHEPNATVQDLTIHLQTEEPQGISAYSRGILTLSMSASSALR